MSPHDADNLRTLAEAWVRKGRAARAADIDAAACGTRRDYMKAVEAEDALHEARDAFDAALTALTDPQGRGLDTRGRAG